MNDPTSNVTYLSSHDVPARVDRDWVTSHELCIEAGITYRQLDYWTRTGLLTTLNQVHPGSGYVRGYPATQVTRAGAIHDLLAAGIGLQTIRDVIDELLETGTVTVGRVTFAHIREAAS